MTSGLDRNPQDRGSGEKEPWSGRGEGSHHVSHAAAVATISMDPTAAEATEDGTGEDQRVQTGAVDGPSSSSDNNKFVAEPQQSGQKGSVHPADRVRGGNAGLVTKVKARHASGWKPAPFAPPAPSDPFPACLSPQDQGSDNSRNGSGELGSSSGSNSLDDGNCSNTAEGGKEMQDGISGNKQGEGQQGGVQKAQQVTGVSPKSQGSGSETRKAGEEKEGGEQGQGEQDVGEQAQGGRPVLKKPDKLEPCPRCDSYDTKFCYYNNYNIKQPRHFCKNCQRYWTAGGTLRNVPVGAGRRKNKHKSLQRLGPGSGSDSELIIPSSSGGEEYLVRTNSIRSTNPPVFKAPNSQGYQGRFASPPAVPNYESPANDKSGVTYRNGSSADEMQSGDQFRGAGYVFRGDDYGAQAVPDSAPPRAKRLKRGGPAEGEGLGVLVGAFGRGVRETSECGSSPNITNREAANFANEMLNPPPEKKVQWVQQPVVPSRGGDAFGGAVNDMSRWNQGANIPVTPAWGGAPSGAAPWGGMWNQPWPYAMPWNGTGAAPVLNTPGMNYPTQAQSPNWGMVENAAFSSGANWGAGQVNAANVAGAAAAWANANVWAGLAAAGNAWAPPPWAAWGMFGAGPAAAAVAPTPVSPMLGKHRREEGAGEGENRADGVWVPKTVRTEPVRGGAPQWQQQLASKTGFLGLMKHGEMGEQQRPEDGQVPQLNLL